MNKAFQIIEAAQRVCQRRDFRRTANRLEEITSAPHYFERGYSTDKPVILFGNWNDPTPHRYDDATRKFVNQPEDKAEADFFAGVVKALEAVAECEWSDEWAQCSECGGAVRTSANSYRWQRSYVEQDGEIICAECAEKHPESVLASFEDQDNRCVTADLGINPGDHGYVKLDQEFENGFYGGQDAEPRKIARAMRGRGITRFLFLLDQVGQFDLKFSVWVHESEKDLMPEALSRAEHAADLDPAEGLKRALQNVPPAPPGPGITYTKVDASTGTATTRKVSPEEFVEGIKD